jgi:hypothetical protein
MSDAQQHEPPNSPREWNPAEIARLVADGAHVCVGPYLILKLDAGDYTATCIRCDATQRIPFTSGAITLAVAECAQFMVKHAHQDVS